MEDIHDGGEISRRNGLLMLQLVGAQWETNSLMHRCFFHAWKLSDSGAAMYCNFGEFAMLATGWVVSGSEAGGISAACSAGVSGAVSVAVFSGLSVWFAG